MPSVAVPLLAGLGPSEILLVILVVLLLFGAKKLPELARGSGRALRIFKAETKGLLEDDDVDEAQKTEAQRELDARRRAEAAAPLETPVQTPLSTPVQAPVEHPRPRPDLDR